MKDLIHHILDVARMKKVDYADIRIVRRQNEEIGVKNGRVEALIHDSDFGFGIRVLFRGAWGFASSSKVTKTEMETVFRKALKIAKASSKAKVKDLFFSSVIPVVDRYQTPVSVNPFDVSTEAKLELLLKADEITRRNKKVRISEAFMGSYKTERIFASTQDAYIEQEIVECGAGMAAPAIEGREVQVRSYPNSFRGNFATKGFEWIEHLILPDHAQRVAEEAEQLLSAKICPSKVTTLILDSSQLALQIHESIGNPWLRRRRGESSEGSHPLRWDSRQPPHFKGDSPFSWKRKQWDHEGRWLEQDPSHSDDEYQSGTWRMDTGADDQRYGRGSFPDHQPQLVN